MPHLSSEQARFANYICAALALTILCTRVLVTLGLRKPVDISLYFVLTSILVVIARLVVNCYYLQYGTASDALNNPAYFDNHEIADIRIGTVLSLVARILIVLQCWLQIGLLLLFYSQIMSGITWVARMTKITWALLGTTFIAIVLTTLLECQPFHLYWQIVPDPGSCVKGYAQITLQCASNILLDLMLLAISWPILRGKGRSLQQHLRIGTIYLLGTFCIIVATFRLIYIYDARSSQSTRSLWASVQMLVSTFVANAPTIYGLLKSRSKKKIEANMRRSSKPEDWPQPYEALAENSDTSSLKLKSSHESQKSNSGPKEWFDHAESLEAGRYFSKAWPK